MTLRQKFNALAALFLLALAAMFAYLRWFEPPFLSYQGLPFKVSGPARPGESVQLVVTRCNSSSSPQDYELSHWLKNIDTGDPPVVLPAGLVPTIKPGCETGRSAMNVIPAGTPPGHYKIGGAGVAKGTLRTVNVDWYSEPFEVVP